MHCMRQLIESTEDWKGKEKGSEGGRDKVPEGKEGQRMGTTGLGLAPHLVHANEKYNVMK